MKIIEANDSITVKLNYHDIALLLYIREMAVAGSEKEIVQRTLAGSLYGHDLYILPDRSGHLCIGKFVYPGLGKPEAVYVCTNHAPFSALIQKSHITFSKVLP